MAHIKYHHKHDDVPVSIWRDLYTKQWADLITPEAQEHPAKYARLLIKKIYHHAFEEGWVAKGDYILDPFAGVGLGALDAMARGLYWRGYEIEEPWFKAGADNIRMWNLRFGNMTNQWGNAMIIHGASQDITSKPSATGYQLAIGSPPFLQTRGGGKTLGGKDEKFMRRHGAGNRGVAAYGATPGQLHNLPIGTIRGAKFKDEPETYWDAALKIVTRVYNALEPGGHAMWVVKDYVENAKRRPFTRDWRKICEKAGFRTVCMHKASVIKHVATSFDENMKMTTTISERKSSFRRMAEKNGAPRIDEELVVCMVKG